jgi:hypothetical protein
MYILTLYGDDQYQANTKQTEFFQQIHGSISTMKSSTIANERPCGGTWRAYIISNDYGPTFAIIDPNLSYNNPLKYHEQANEQNHWRNTKVTHLSYLPIRSYFEALLNKETTNFKSVFI